MNQNFTWYTVMVIIMVLYYYAKQTERYDMKPPVANQNHYKTTLHGQERIHNYHCILDILVKEILRNADKNCHDAKNLVEKTFEDYFATSMVRKKMGLDKIHPLNARIRNYFERLIGFACRNVNYFEKKIRPNDYTVNSTIYSNIEYQKEIASIVKLYYKYPVL